ncbi:MAG: tetratricopeptide repeat protein, partial [Bdellovibrionales bacterium]|nr:tetratricopeptide repeat protein [Bdellovibrionales bacterium]
NWLKPSTRLDIKYQIGQAYEQGGVYEPAIKYYSEVLNKVYSYRDTKEGKERLIKEKLPSEELLNLRLAVAEDQSNNFSKAFDFLKAIKNPNKLTEQQQVERIMLASTLYDKRGDVDSAILYLTELLKYWKGQPELVAAPYFKLSQLELRKDKRADAIESLKQVDNLMADTGLVSEEIHRNSLQQIAKIYDEDKNYDQAIVWYEKLLDRYEDKVPLASIRYRLGKIYFNIGKIQKASSVWSQFKGENSDSWKKIAKEQIRSYEWMNKNKKFIDRLPASQGKP